MQRSWLGACVLSGMGLPLDQQSVFMQKIHRGKSVAYTLPPRSDEFPAIVIVSREQLKPAAGHVLLHPDECLTIPSENRSDLHLLLTNWRALQAHTNTCCCSCECVA